MRSPASEVYEHEMPGGQYTNLRQQARAIGIEGRWREVARAYAAVNRLFGDIIKVTPTSKVVGDLAIFMVTNDLTPEDILDPEKDIAFPESVVEFFHGDLGLPPGGFPEELQRKVLKGKEPLRVRPGQVLPPTDLREARAEVEKKVRRSVSDRELASYLMYPKVFVDFAEHQRVYGDVSVLPTPAFFYGLEHDEELAIEIERGKTLIIRFLAVGDADAEGRRPIYFELNGQPREVKILDRALAPSGAAKRKAEEGNPSHVAAPMPGMVVSLSVSKGQKVARGDRLLSIEAMKMETAVFADRTGTVEEILVSAGTQVDTKDLLILLAPEEGPPPEEPGEGEEADEGEETEASVGGGDEPDGADEAEGGEAASGDGGEPEADADGEEAPATIAPADGGDG
jgi:pyruvate carboxylase